MNGHGSTDGRAVGLGLLLVLLWLGLVLLWLGLILLWLRLILLRLNLLRLGLRLLSPQWDASALLLPPLGHLHHGLELRPTASDVIPLLGLVLALGKIAHNVVVEDLMARFRGLAENTRWLLLGSSADMNMIFEPRNADKGVGRGAQQDDTEREAHCFLHERVQYLIASWTRSRRRTAILVRQDEDEESKEDGSIEDLVHPSCVIHHSPSQVKEIFISSWSQTASQPRCQDGWLT